MAKTPKDKDQDKGDEILRRLLKTPPDHKTGKGKSDEAEPDGTDSKRDRPAPAKPRR